MSNAAKDKSLPHKLPIADQKDESTFGEQLLEKIKPHSNLIMLTIVALFLLFIAIAWLIKGRADVAEGEWILLSRQMGMAGLNGNLSGIKEVLEDYPDGKAGLWGLQIAGDFELRQGIFRLATDPAEGLKEIEKAKASLKKIVDAPANRKSTMLQVRSTLSLAYAHESLGEFEAARKLYQQLVDQAPDSAFGRIAKRGLERTTNPAYAVIYEKFKNWKDPFAVAPGAESDKKPNISFPDVEANPDQSDSNHPGTGNSSDESAPANPTEPESVPESANEDSSKTENNLSE